MQDIRVIAICEHLHVSYYDVMDKEDSADVFNMLRIVITKSDEMDEKSVRKHGVSETAFGVDKESAIEMFGGRPKE